MNEPQQAELRALREEQQTLRRQLGALDERLARLERSSVNEVMSNQPAAVVPPPLPPALLVKLPERVPLSLDEIQADASRRLAGEARPPKAPEPSLPLPQGSPGLPPRSVKEARSTSKSPSPLPTSEGRESLEMRIGTTWLVRAGVVLMLTAFAFLGAFLYQNVVPHLGPAAKVALLYLGAGALTGAGAFLERSRQAQGNPRLRNYAGVVFAGGLSAVYYVTYAAHYFERLRVVPNAIVAGAMLLAWTAFMVGLAHRRNSETLATIAILLAYYTAAINEGVAAFTLFSNLALTAGSVFLLRRHLWRVFPFASVLATFGSYGFWTYYHSLLGWRWWQAAPTHAAHGAGGFWVEAAFLAVYWALFTWVVFTAAEGVLPTGRRASFASLNNGAFFSLTTWLVLGEGPGWFWKWSLGFGVVLLALSEVCRRSLRPTDGKTEDAYLLQGVLLVSTGLIAYFDGWQLSVALAVEAVALLAAGWRRGRTLLVVCSLGSALLAFWWGLLAFKQSTNGMWLTPLGVGALLIGAAALAQRIKERAAVATEPVASTTFRQVLDPAPAIYALLGTVMWWFLINERVEGHNASFLVFGAAGVALTASVYALRVRELPLYAQAFVVTGFVGWFNTTTAPQFSGVRPSNWTALGLFAAILAAGHWWQRLPGQTGWTRGRLTRCFNALDAVLAVAVAWSWFAAAASLHGGRDANLAAGTAVLALLLTAYGVKTCYRALAMAAQGPLLAAGIHFADLMNSAWNGNRSEPFLAAVPLLVVLAELALAWKFVPSTRTALVWRVAATVYELLAAVMFLTWARHYLPADTLLPIYALAGAGLYAMGIGWNVRRWTILSFLLTLAALEIYLLPDASVDQANPLALLGVVAFAGQQQWAKRRVHSLTDTPWLRWWQMGLMAAATVCGWVFVTTIVGGAGAGFKVTAAWSIFAAATFVAGLLLRERIYRWLGLLIMGATLVRIIVNDILSMDSLGKAISIFALAAVLLGVGFLYNKYQDKFRDLL